MWCHLVHFGAADEGNTNSSAYCILCMFFFQLFIFGALGALGAFFLVSFHSLSKDSSFHLFSFLMQLFHSGSWGLCLAQIAGAMSVKKTIEKTKKRVDPAKYWCFTWFDYPENYRDILFNLKKADKIIAGEELCSTTGKHHLQGWLAFSSRNRPDVLGLPKQVHWERAKGSYEDNHHYCSKDGKVFYKGIDRPYTLDIILRPWQQSLYKILLDEPHDRTIYWVYDTLGGVGKTYFQKYAFLNLTDAVVLSGKGSDMKNGVLQYQEKNKRLPKVVLVDIPRSTDPQYVSYTGLEEVKNMFFFSGKYEGGMVCGSPPHLMIFANVAPDYSRFSTDRWKVYQIAGDLVPMKLELGEWRGTPFSYTDSSMVD